MKIKKIILLLVLCLATAMVGFSEPPKQQYPPSNTSSGKTDKSGISVLRLVRYGSAGKRAPSRNSIELYYENGVLTVLSSTMEGEISITLTNNENLETIPVEAILLGECLYIYLDCGSYSVIAEDSNNNTFTGEMLIE